MKAQSLNFTLTVALLFFQVQFFAQGVISPYTPIGVAENAGSANINNSYNNKPQQLNGISPISPIVHEQNSSNMLVNGKVPALLPQNSQMLNQETNSILNSEEAINLSPYITDRTKAVSVTDAFSNASSCTGTYSYATLPAVFNIPEAQENTVSGMVVAVPIH